MHKQICFDGWNKMEVLCLSMPVIDVLCIKERGAYVYILKHYYHYAFLLLMILRIINECISLFTILENDKCNFPKFACVYMPHNFRKLKYLFGNIT